MGFRRGVRERQKQQRTEQRWCCCRVQSHQHHHHHNTHLFHYQKQNLYSYLSMSSQVSTFSKYLLLCSKSITCRLRNPPLIITNNISCCVLKVMSSGGNMRFPFTARQWQELQHQALIFKHMLSAMPIPPHLLLSINRSQSCFDSSQQHFGWKCCEYEVGLGLGLGLGLGKRVDPEPGRCRRTDGKKWRCSKEAYPDSKYCERHMHRGKNRSRKPLQPSISDSSKTHFPDSSQEDTNLLLCSASYSQSQSHNNNSHYRSRYGNGAVKEVVDEEPLLRSEARRSLCGSDSWWWKQRSCSEEPKQHPQKRVHRFLEDQSSNGTTTRLSISIPTSSLDFPIFNSTTQNA